MIVRDYIMMDRALHVSSDEQIAHAMLAGTQKLVELNPIVEYSVGWEYKSKTGHVLLTSFGSNSNWISRLCICGTENKIGSSSVSNTSTLVEHGGVVGQWKNTTFPTCFRLTVGKHKTNLLHVQNCVVNVIWQRTLLEPSDSSSRSSWPCATKIQSKVRRMVGKFQRNWGHPCCLPWRSSRNSASAHWRIIEFVLSTLVTSYSTACVLRFSCWFCSALCHHCWAALPPSTRCTPYGHNLGHLASACIAKSVIELLSSSAFILCMLPIPLPFGRRDMHFHVLALVRQAVFFFVAQSDAFWFLLPFLQVFLQGKLQYSVKNSRLDIGSPCLVPLLIGNTSLSLSVKAVHPCGLSNLFRSSTYAGLIPLCSSDFHKALCFIRSNPCRGISYGHLWRFLSSWYSCVSTAKSYELMRITYAARWSENNCNCWWCFHSESTLLRPEPRCTSFDPWLQMCASLCASLCASSFSVVSTGGSTAGSVIISSVVAVLSGFLSTLPLHVRASPPETSSWCSDNPWRLMCGLRLLSPTLQLESRCQGESHRRLFLNANASASTRPCWWMTGANGHVLLLELLSNCLPVSSRLSSRTHLSPASSLRSSATLNSSSLSLSTRQHVEWLMKLTWSGQQRVLAQRHVSMLTARRPRHTVSDWSMICHAHRWTESMLAARFSLSSCRRHN